MVSFLSENASCFLWPVGCSTKGKVPGGHVVLFKLLKLWPFSLSPWVKLEAALAVRTSSIPVPLFLPLWQ